MTAHRIISQPTVNVSQHTAMLSQGRQLDLRLSRLPLSGAAELGCLCQALQSLPAG
jgi:hypothetical protein